MPNNYEQPVLPEEQVDTEEESLESGNRKLGLIAGAVVVLLGAAIAFVPAGNRERIANGQMPSFELLGASVVAERPTEEATPAPAAAPVEAAAPAAKTAAPAPRPAAKPVASTTTPTAEAAAPVGAAAPVEPAVSVAAPVEEPVAAPAPVVEEAPRSVTLKGRVLDENGRPLAGATVFVKGTGKFASTDQNGNYAVETSAGEHSLVYGYGGYQDQEMRVRSGQANNVTLVPSESGRRSRKR